MMPFMLKTFEMSPIPRFANVGMCSLVLLVKLLVNAVFHGAIVSNFLIACCIAIVTNSLGFGNLTMHIMSFLC